MLYTIDECNTIRRKTEVIRSENVNDSRTIESELGISASQSNNESDLFEQVAAAAATVKQHQFGGKSAAQFLVTEIVDISIIVLRLIDNRCRNF